MSLKMNRMFLICAILTAVILPVFAFAQEPGSAEDPLVSKSYVDAKIAEALAAAALPPQTQTPAAAGGAFVPVSLAAGQIVIGGEGTEIILRSGRGAAYHSGADGVVNITDGAELFVGDAVEKNNLIIVPRADGRGVQVFEDSWLLIKGGYYVIN